MPWWEQNIGMGGALSAKQQTSADSRTESLQPLSDEREAGGIEEDVDDRPQIIVHSTEPESHLQHILYRQG